MRRWYKTAAVSACSDNACLNSKACSKQWPSLVTVKIEALLPTVTNGQQNWQHHTGASQTLPWYSLFEWALVGLQV
jgi:hypothetical protein